MDFSKAFDSVRHPDFYQKLIWAGLPPCFARSTQSLLSDRGTCVVFQNHKRRSFGLRRGAPQGSAFDPVLFSFFINNFSTSLPSSVSCSLYANNLAICSSFLSVPATVEATQGALIRRLSSDIFLSIQANMRPLSSQWIPAKLTFCPIFFY